MTGESVLLLLLPFFVVFAVLSAIAARRRARARKAVAWIRAKYGRDIQLIAGCEIIDSRKRAGVIALAGNLIVWRSVVFNKEFLGEIQLSDIELLMWEDAGRFHKGRLLTVKERSGIEYHFVLHPSHAAVWEKVLEYRVV
jgi:hypothetical protein